jgi:hypothetical protein
MLKRRMFLLAALLTLTATGVAVGFATSSKHSAVRLARASRGVDVKSHFAVFRRSARAVDRIPRRGATTASVAQESSRLVLDTDGVQIYALDRGDGQLCLVYHAESDGFGSTTCTSTAQANLGALPPELTMATVNRTDVYMLLPDGVSSVQATTKDGTNTEVPVGSNAVALPPNSQRVSWNTADGRSHALTHLSPAFPKQAAAAAR